MMLLLAATLVGCNKEGKDKGPDSIDDKLVGEWVLTEWNGETPEFVVYIDFNKDTTFAIYQQVWSLDYQMFDGTCRSKKGVLSGSYADGSAWATDYKYSVSGSKLTLTSQDGTSVKSVYEKCEIPAEVITEATTTRSAEVVPFL